MNPNKKGRYYFHFLSKRKLTEGWKTMEFTLGAFGGLGLALGFCAGKNIVAETARCIDENGSVWNPISGAEPYMPLILAVIVLGVVLINAVSFEMDHRGKKVNSFVCDLIERPLYNLVPMCLVLLGSQMAARIMTFFMLFAAMALKCAFDRFEDFKGLRIWQVILVASTAAVFLAEILTDGFTAWQTWFLCGAPYLILDMIYTFRPKVLPELKARIHSAYDFVLHTRLIVHLCFFVQIAVMYIAGFRIFAA